MTTVNTRLCNTSLVFGDFYKKFLIYNEWKDCKRLFKYILVLFYTAVSIFIKSRFKIFLNYAFETICK